ncbi:MAG: S8 family serine peptidase, partial [Candidatus Hydrogenedentes bacterium]|nr:S8 family serine peptidase [Candidatus Hydrogenedentota bacterium]
MIKSISLGLHVPATFLLLAIAASGWAGGHAPFSRVALPVLEHRKQVSPSPQEKGSARRDEAIAHAQTAGMDDRVLLVGFEPASRAAARDAVHAQADATVIHRYKHFPIEVVRLPATKSADAAMATYRQAAGVRGVARNVRFKALAMPDDPAFPEMWGLNNTGQTGGQPDADIDAPEAWDLTTGSTDVTVAVVDTGVDYTHPDLASQMWVNKEEFDGQPGVDDDGNEIVDDIFGARWTNGDGTVTSGDPMDDNSHGTHVAGTIGAAGNNGEGVTGINWNVRIMALKFLDEFGFGAFADALSTVDYLLDQGVHVANASWGGYLPLDSPEALIGQVALEAAGAAGMMLIAAAGNEALDNDVDIPGIGVSLPAAYPLDNVFSVASTDDTDALSFFSNYGLLSVELAAPGEEILSTVPGNGYALFSGTSMATPHVTGVAALLWSLAPDAHWSDIRQWLLEAAEPVQGLQGKVATGGRLNAARAVELAAPGRGAIRFDRAAYRCDTSAGIHLRDTDLAGTGTAAVQVTSTTGDKVTVFLAETAEQAGEFEGTVPLAEGTPVEGDHLLQVAHGGEIAVSYQDASDNTGLPRTVTGLANTDCLPPVLTQFALDQLGPDTAIFRVGTSEEGTLTITYGHSCAALDRSGVFHLDPSDTFAALVNLRPASTYFYKATLADAAGNSVEVSNEGGCFSFETHPLGQCSQAVTFPDPGLEQAIRDNLGIYERNLCVTDLFPIESLALDFYGIENLAGIEFCPNLKVLTLYTNAVVDISPLAPLTKLEVLDLGANEIGDLSSLASLTRLRELYLDDNQATSLAPLEDLEQLRVLFAAGNTFEDATPLAQLDQLQVLDLSGNPLNGLESVASLPALQALGLMNCGTPDIAPLAALTGLVELYVDGNGITSAAALETLEGLRALSLSNNQITEIGILSALSSLDTLWLDQNQLVDLTPLAALPGIAYLNVSFNPLNEDSCNFLDNLLAAGVFVEYFGTPCESGGGIPPANDSCAAALPVGVNEAVSGDTSSAMTDVPSPCSNDAKDVWHMFVAPRDGNYVFSLCGSQFDTTLSVYDGLCGTLNVLGCNDDSCFWQSQVIVSLTAGANCLVRIAGFAGDFGPYTLQVTE